MTDTQRKPEVAFIGTGIMGAAMCRRILLDGNPVSVWNRTHARAAPLANLGARVCETVDDAIRTATFVVCMLENGPVIDRVLFEASGTSSRAIDSLQTGASLVVMSSIPVESARAHAAILGGMEVDYIDAPVSGGEKGAREGTLTIMAGGDAAAVGRATPLLESMGRVTHIGPAGTGQLCKLANQAIVGITIGAVAEALTLAGQAGADIAAVRSALSGGFADSTILREHGQRMIDNEFTPGARAALQLKDLNTARSLAEAHRLELPLLRFAERQFRRMCEQGYGEMDHSALYLFLQALNSGPRPFP